jgi:thiopeptide-type bacteriocin biosynthesis protein
LCPSCAAATRGPSWLQINLALPARGGAHAESLAGVFENIFPLVESMKQRKLLRWFFFMRKPPGLRLRFSLRGPGGDAAREVESCAERLVRLKLAGKWFASVYEPETFKFGGPEAMEAVHAHFFADSAAWWRWESLRRRAKTSISSKLLSLGVLNDLFARFVEGPEEVWDVWCRVAALHGAPAVAGDGPAAPAIRIDDLLEHVTPRERAVLRSYSTHNGALARRFGALLAGGKLLYRNRLVLPHVALYHWNRYGFTPEDRASIFTAMVRAWSPNE